MGKTLSEMPRLFFCLLAVFLLTGCARNEVKLSFELPQDVNTPCRILYYASGKNVGMVRETVVEITGGKGEIILPMHYPTVIYLFSPSQKVPAALIYGRHGDKFKITGSDANIGEWAIAGNRETEELSDWRIANAALIRSRGSDAVKLNRAVAEYVKAHPGSPAAAIILYYYFTRRDHEKEFYELLGTLDRKVTDDEMLITAISMPDLITGLPDTTAIPRRIVLTGDSGYADTLSPSKISGGLMLLFRGQGAEGIANDSLKKALIKRGGKTMAELYMEPDSLSWRRYLRKDTLDGLRRLWMPLGMADSLAIGMGVRRVPYYIVTGPGGKEIYRGDDWQEALRKFENLKE